MSKNVLFAVAGLFYPYFVLKYINLPMFLAQIASLKQLNTRWGMFKRESGVE